MKGKQQQVSMKSYVKAPAVNHGEEDAKPIQSKVARPTQESRDLNPAVRKRVLPASVYQGHVSKPLPSSGEEPGYPRNRVSRTTTTSTPKEQSESIIPIDLYRAYKLSQSQRKVLEVIMERKSVFFTGAAGTGKSYVVSILRTVIETLQWESKIAYTAPTGVAACNIRGLTIHSWAGIGRAVEPIEQLLGIVMRNSQACRRWRQTEILVIDEISMLSADVLDKLDIIGRRVRGSLLPFGGLQVILCGDFFQLPPVGLGKTTKFCFESGAWKDLFGERPDCMVVLDKVFRQKDDTTFLQILNEMRLGQLSRASQDMLRRKVTESMTSQPNPATSLASASGFVKASSLTPSPSSSSQRGGVSNKVLPTKLFSTNQDVDQHNQAEFERLSSLDGQDDDDDPLIYQAVDNGRDPYLSQLRQGTKAPERLLLKKGAQVMLLKNLDTEAGLVNGARGIVIGFERSQGRTAFCAHLPVVQFTVIMGGQRSEINQVLMPDTWDVKLGDQVLASRQQIPLILAWAISIHKSQGMTIPLLEVSFRRMFEYGQAYVALSRATSLDGLTLTSFEPQTIKAHPLVKEFYAEMLSRQRQAGMQAASQSAQSAAGRDDILTVSLKELVERFQSCTYDRNERQGQQQDADDWQEIKRMPVSSSQATTSSTISSAPPRAGNNTSTPAATVVQHTMSARPSAPTQRPPDDWEESRASSSAVNAATRPAARPVQAARITESADDWLDADFLERRRREVAELKQRAQEQQQHMRSQHQETIQGATVRNGNQVVNLVDDDEEDDDETVVEGHHSTSFHWDDEENDQPGRAEQKVTPSRWTDTTTSRPVPQTLPTPPQPSRPQSRLLNSTFTYIKDERLQTASSSAAATASEKPVGYGSARDVYRVNDVQLPEQLPTPPATSNSAGDISASLKRKMEENRLQALQKLEAFKRRKQMEEGS